MCPTAHPPLGPNACLTPLSSLLLSCTPVSLLLPRTPVSLLTPPPPLSPATASALLLPPLLPVPPQPCYCLSPEDMESFGSYGVLQLQLVAGPMQQQQQQQHDHEQQHGRQLEQQLEEQRQRQPPEVAALRSSTVLPRGEGRQGHNQFTSS